MFTTIADFDQTWSHESEATLKLLRVLTDASLAQAVEPQGRTLGRLAWHVATTIGEMMGRTGLKLSGPAYHSMPPAAAAGIVSAYQQSSESLREQIKRDWTDATLGVADDMYGEQWKRALTLQILVSHQTHHRGQMTVLMRQAGLKVPGVYGPAREEWAAYGMPAPPV